MGKIQRDDSEHTLAIANKRVKEAWSSEPLASLLAGLDGNAHGLSVAQAVARLEQYGANVLQPHRKRTILVEFLSRFRNPLVVLLLAASALSALTGEITSFSIITLLVVSSVTLDFVQEYRAGQAAEKLRQTVAIHVSVIRDGVVREIPAAQVVPGDVVRLSAGDLVPADGRLLEANDLFVNQALLTGEPYPVEKHAGEITGAAGDSDGEANAVFMGTSIISGIGKVFICRTGENTVLGEIAENLATKPPPTAFEQGIRQFGLMIVRLTVFLALFVLLVNLYFHEPGLETFLFAMALAVGLTPELLPMIISVTLARGAMRMAQQQVIVKRLGAIQNLGSMDILCTDKTGTLTEARIRLERHLDVRGNDSAHVLELAYLNSYFESGLKSPLDDAILKHDTVDVSAWHKVDEVPFDFERRRIAVLVDNHQSRLLVVKGAPEDILDLCTTYEAAGPDQLQSLDDRIKQQIMTQLRTLGREGFRVLAIAWRHVSADHSHAVLSDESELVFAGLAAFLDPPKVSAGPALAWLAGSGVSVKIVTGDNEWVTQHICRELGLAVTGILMGHNIAEMDQPALQARVESANIFCRVTPAQKNRIILALKQRKHVVGYLGDGINDAPSLHSADVSISVDNAVDVAKEAAELILLQQDLDVLHQGVLEGRRTFGNIMKYIMMGTTPISAICSVWRRPLYSCLSCRCCRPKCCSTISCTTFPRWRYRWT